MKARGFLTKASKRSQISVGKYFTPIILTAVAMASLSANSVSAESIIEHNLMPETPSVVQVHSAFSPAIPSN